MSTSNRRRYASLADTAQYLGVFVMTIRRAVSSGLITGYRFGTRIIRVDLAEIDPALRVTSSAASAGWDG